MKCKGRVSPARIARNNPTAAEELKEKQPALLRELDHLDRTKVEKMRAHGVIEKVDTVYTSSKNYAGVWKLTKEAERGLDVFDGGDLFPCECLKDAFLTIKAGELYQCKDCEKVFEKEEMNLEALP